MEDSEIKLRHLEVLARMSETALQSGERYQNIVFGMFYAGFFAFWFGVKDSLQTSVVLIAGFFMIVSILIYALWVVYNAQYLISVQKLASAKLLDASNLNKLLELENASDLGDKTQRLYRFQPYVFYSSICSASVGILALLYGFIRGFLISIRFL